MRPNSNKINNDPLDSLLWFLRHNSTNNNDQNTATLNHPPKANHSNNNENFFNFISSIFNLCIPEREEMSPSTAVLIQKAKRKYLGAEGFAIM